MRFAIEADFACASSENLSHLRRAKLNYVNMCVELDRNWSSLRPVESALHCDHVTRKIRSCKPNGQEIEREGDWSETGGKTKQRFAGHFGCGRAARHALYSYMPWVRRGEQLVNQSGALVFFNINHTEHTARWRHRQEWPGTTTVEELLSSAELPSGFWGHDLTLISICNTCLARCRCPQLECYWWVMALTKHHHHSSYMELGEGLNLALLCWHF